MEDSSCIKMVSIFSDVNAPYLLRDVDWMSVAEEPLEPPLARPLVRQTNEWQNYFGEFGVACAELGMDSGFQSRIGQGGNYITRHVLQVPIDSRDLLLSPSNNQIGRIQRDVRDKVERIYMQLEMFADAGLFVWRRENGGAELTYRDEKIFLRFVLVQDTSMFHVIISKRSRYVMGVFTYPEMDSLSSLIYCLRMIFITPGMFNTFEFELNAEDIQRASEVTFELSLLPPQEEEPEWINDENVAWP